VRRTKTKAALLPILMPIPLLMARARHSRLARHLKQQLLEHLAAREQVRRQMQLQMENRDKRAQMTPTDRPIERRFACDTRFGRERTRKGCFRILRS
jgi:hypothetical protein